MNCSVEESPIFIPEAPEANTTRTTRPKEEIIAGRLDTALPSFAQRPVSLLFLPPNLGVAGQKIPRPKIAKAAGSTNSALIIAKKTPVAHAIPNDLLP